MRRRLVVLVAVVGLACSVALTGLGWYGIHLLVTVGPPFRADQTSLWLRYGLVVLGALAAGAGAFACFGFLERRGLGPPRV